MISIHALRVEGDRSAGYVFLLFIEFLSTPSGWRATVYAPSSLTYFEKFLSTPSGWRATRHPSGVCFDKIHFYPRPPGGGRQQEIEQFVFGINFYPRPPGGGRPDKVNHNISQQAISIHALRVEGDLTHEAEKAIQIVISIHALRVEGD